MELLESLRKKLTLILNDEKINDEDNLYSRFITSLTQSILEKKTIDFSQFQDEISKKKLERIKNKINELIDDFDGTFVFDCEKLENTTIEFKNEIVDKNSKSINNIDCIKEKISLIESRMPSCLEKHTLCLINKIKLELNSMQSFSIENEIKAEVNLFLSRLEIELSNDKNLPSIYNNIKSQIESGLWKPVLSDLSDLLKRIRPLDIFELENLIDKSKKAANLIQNKDVILFLGNTGSGKSTLIHFLSGSKMIKKRVEIEPNHFLDHITTDDGFEYLYSNLSNVKISYKSESETRYITPVQINLKDIGGNENKNVILCDTPGFGDTSGAEMDIANGACIIDAIKNCKSIKPVVLINYLDIGGRGDGIKELAYFFVDMINNVQEYISSFYYIFTQFPQDTDIYAALVNIKNSINDPENESFNEFFEDLLEKTERNSFISFDPLNGKPFKLLKSIIKSGTIKDPSNAFKHTIKDKSKKIIKEQVKLDELCIISAIKRDEYLIVKFKLDGLKYLHDILKQDFISQTYENCLSYLKKEINLKYNNLISSFNSCVIEQNKLNNELLDLYENHAHNFENLKVFNSIEELASINGLSVAPLANLNDLINNRILVNLKDLNLNSNEIKINLDNLKLIAIKFIEINKFYEEGCIIIKQRLTTLIEEISRNLIEKKFIDISTNLNKYFRSIENLNSHLLEATKSEYENLVDFVNTFLINTSRKIETILETEKMNENELKLIDECLTILDEAKESNGLKELISKEILDNFYSQTILMIIQYLTKVINKIRCVFCQENNDITLDEIKELMNRIKLLRTIQIIEIKSSDIYHSVIQEIINYMNQIRKETEKMLINPERNRTELSKLFTNLNELKKFEWINDHKEKAYDKILNNIAKELIDNTIEIYTEFQEYNLSIKNFDNISKAYRCILKLNDFKLLEKSINEIKIYREFAEKSFNESIETAFKFIKTIFDLSRESIEEIKNKLKQLNLIRLEYDSLHSSILYLKQKKIENIQIVLIKIKELEDEIQKIDNNLELLNKELDEIKNDLKHFELGELDENDAKTLIEKGVSNFNEAEKKMNFIEEKKVSLRDEKESKSNNLKELQSVLETYNELKLKNEVSQEAKEFLSNLKYENINHLERKIEETQTQIRISEAKGHLITFKKVCLLTLSNSLFYLVECKSIRPLEKKSEEAETELLNNIQNYVEYIGREIDYSFNKIQASSTDAFSNAQLIKNYLKELNEIDKYSNLKILLINSEIRNLKDKFENYLILLTEELNRDAANNLDLKNKLEKVKALSLLDSYINGKYIELYHKYQTVLIANFKEIYTKILNYIEQYDYINVSAEILEINEFPINQNAFNQIKRFLTNSILQLLDKTITLAAMLGNNLEDSVIKTITSNINNLENAKKYLVFEIEICNNYLDQSVLDRLDKDIKVIKELINKKLLEYLDSIEALINMNEFYEAEEKRENLRKICLFTNNYFVSQELTLKIDKIQQTLENIVNEISKKYTEMDLNDYILNPPKILLDRLSKVACRNYKYSQSVSELRYAILKKYKDSLNEAKKAKEDKREETLQVIESTLGSLPEEIKTAIEVEVKNLKKYIDSKEIAYQNEYKRLSTFDDLQGLYNFRKKCIDDGLNNFNRLIQENILNEVVKLKKDIFELLEAQDLKNALIFYEKVTKMVIVFGDIIIELKKFNNEIEKLMIKEYEKNTSLLVDIEVITNMQHISRSLENFILFIEFKNEKLNENDQSDLKIKIINSENEIYLSLFNYFNTYQSKLFLAVDSLNMLNVQETIFKIKKHEKILLKFKNFLKKSPENELIKEILKLKSYDELISNLETKLNHLSSDIMSYEPITGYEKEREIYYQEFTKKLIFLKEADKVKDHLINNYFDLTTFKNIICPFLEHKFEAIIDDGIRILDIESLIKSNIDNFRLIYENCHSFEKHSKSLLHTDLKISFKDLHEAFNQRQEEIQNKFNQKENSLEEKAQCLIELKLFADSLPSLNQNINEKIDLLLIDFSKKYKNDGIALDKLGTILDKDSIGSRIINEHKIFKGIAISIFTKKTQCHNIDYVIENLDGDNIDKHRLLYSYTDFEMQYKRSVEKYLFQLETSQNKLETLKPLINDIKNSPHTLKSLIKSKKYDYQSRDNLIKLLADLFALWTLTNTNYYEEMKGVEDRNTFLYQPHPGQIVTILRLLGIGYFKLEPKKDFKNKAKSLVGLEDYEKIVFDSLRNNFVQVGTGEGKSLILAFTSCVLVLIGYEVSCACYSNYLSSRDYQQFLPIFDLLGITNSIHYGTFNKICENIINENGDIRTRIVNLILNHKTDNSLDNTSSNRILLIDEVDVFFSEDFYGNIYTPLSLIKDDSIIKLAEYIWRNRNSSLNFKKIENSSEFKNCISIFKNWEFLIQSAVKDMLSDLMEFKHDYIVKNNKIAYKEQDDISYDVVYGYKTMFAYFYESENNKITVDSLKENIFISIRSGSFSYAQIPHRFDFIMGVTGTLKTLSNAEKNIIENIYNVNFKTFMPSVFGKNKRKFAYEDDIYIENKDDYFNILREKIDQALDNKIRAVLVFFEDKSKLLRFYNSKNVAPIKGDIQIMTEDSFSNNIEKEIVIKRATTSGQITFLTKVFGRGTDFICRDQIVLNNRGVHVIQTFFSEEFSEEIQIMGRTARQGQDGSFSMVLLDTDLEKYLGVSYREIISDIRANKKTYESLNEKRSNLFDLKYNNLNNANREAKLEHDKGQIFIEWLNNNKLTEIKNFLNEKNIGANSVNDSKIICLMDATGSMSHLINQVKNTVSIMFDRAFTILKDNGIPANSFQIQFAVYRDYDCKEDLFQYSPWETNAANLKKFLTNVVAKGGDDYEEAIEIGLWHANVEDDKFGISQIILIGDAPAKSESTIIDYRRKYGGENYWKITPYKEATFYKKELEKLKAKNIPIHCFYLHEGAKANFKEISSSNNGRCEELDINSSNGAEILTNIVTEQILASVGQACGKGNQLVNQYIERFKKGHK